MRETLLGLSHVRFAYPNGPTILNNLNLEIEQGSFTVILGDSGAGKSTLSRIIANVMPEHEGKLEGKVYRPEHSTTGSEYKKTWSEGPLIGYMGGEASSFVIGVVEDELAFGPANMGVSAEEIEYRIEKELTRIGLPSYRYAAVEQLSGGQQQQVAASSVWTMMPQLLVMDDAWSHLDYAAKRLFSDALLSWLDESPNHTLVMILPRIESRDQSHPLWERADWFRLEQGQLIETVSFYKEAHSRANRILIDEIPPLDSEINRGCTHVSEQEQKPILELHQAGVRYPISSFCIRADGKLMSGDAVLLQGANGSGKTTLLHLLTQSLPLEYGEMNIFGQPLKELRAHELARLIGYVPQSSYAMFLCDTVQQELEFTYDAIAAMGAVPLGAERGARPYLGTTEQMQAGKKATTHSELMHEGREYAPRSEWVRTQLERLHLLECATIHPSELPIAARRMLNILLASAHQPLLLILDEPTAGLDEAAANKLIQYCDSLRQEGMALIAATHDELWDIYVSQRSNWKVWFMEKGVLNTGQ